MRHLRSVPDPGRWQPAEEAPGPCEVCGSDQHLTRVPAVDGAGPVDACRDHVTRYVSRSHDLDWLATRRATVDGEPVAHARAALLGQTDTADAS